MIRFFRFLIRISSFLGKELTEIFRQPKLILTLVLGPFLIMFLFGLASPSQGRTLRTTFVVTDPNSFKEQIDSFATSFSAVLVDYVIESDNEKALAALAHDRTDMVIVVPDVPLETIQNNQQAEFLIYHNEIDPFQIGYIHSVAQVYIEEINRQFLQSVVEQEQGASAPLQTNMETAIVKMQTLRGAIPAGDVNTAKQAADLEKDLTNLNEKLTTFRKLGADILVRPFSAKISGLSDVQLTVIGFFAPAVIVLLLQHFSITFASLSIVRETRSGIMELFKVAPITAFETLVGKYISYLFFEIILAGIITVLAVWLLKIPILGPLQDYALAVVVLLFTSLGLGFLISLISETDTQAIQYSMLLLLASIFFSGFFLDLRLMKEPITFLAWSLPATYGIRMLQNIMLRGSSVPQLVFLGIASIGIVLFLIDWLLLRKKMESQYS
jgi:ABC-2 type transport system permease protein